MMNYNDPPQMTKGFDSRVRETLQNLPQQLQRHFALLFHRTSSC